MKRIAINPDADIAVRHIADDDFCVVVDDFLQHPEELVDFAAANRTAFEEQAIGYPGVLYDVAPDAMADIQRFIRSHRGVGCRCMCFCASPLPATADSLAIRVDN